MRLFDRIRAAPRSMSGLARRPSACSMFSALSAMATHALSFRTRPCRTTCTHLPTRRRCTRPSGSHTPARSATPSGTSPSSLRVVTLSIRQDVARAARQAKRRVVARLACEALNALDTVDIVEHRCARRSAPFIETATASSHATNGASDGVNSARDLATVGVEEEERCSGEDGDVARLVREQDVEDGAVGARRVDADKSRRVPDEAAPASSPVTTTLCPTQTPAAVTRENAPVTRPTRRTTPPRQSRTRQLPSLPPQTARCPAPARIPAQSPVSNVVAPSPQRTSTVPVASTETSTPLSSRVVPAGRGSGRSPAAMTMTGAGPS